MKLLFEIVHLQLSTLLQITHRELGRLKLLSKSSYHESEISLGVFHFEFGSLKESVLFSKRGAQFLVAGDQLDFLVL